jgi:hypothetical protein
MATIKKALPKIKSGGAPKKACGGKVTTKMSGGGKMKRGC